MSSLLKNQRFDVSIGLSRNASPLFLTTSGVILIADAGSAGNDVDSGVEVDGTEAIFFGDLTLRNAVLQISG